MMNFDIKNKFGNYDINKINQVTNDFPIEFINEVELDYQSYISNLAKKLLPQKTNCRVVMLSGPSSSGKTTTAKLIGKNLKLMGIGTKVISLDDFYRGQGMAPQLPNGKFDYEDIEALNINKLQECLFNLVNEGYCDKPLFDFDIRQPKNYTEHIKLEEDEIVIIEGIHALNPIIFQSIPQRKIIKCYISLEHNLYDEFNNLVFSAQDIRFIRRLVRDFRFRNTTAQTTLSMWEEVCRGEKKHIRPFKASCNILIDSIHAYEPCVIGKEALNLLNKVNEDDEYYKYVKYIKQNLNNINFVAEDFVPKTSLMREFIGNGKFN